MAEADPTVERAQARVGQTLRGKWRLEQLIGVGGMAAVYKATHRNGMRGAVKMLHLELSTLADVRERFLREGYAANKVDHPGVVRVLDDDVSEDGSVFLVMELLEGRTVDALAESRPGCRLELGETLAIADMLLDVLAVAHEKGIVHRDLKPENLFLTTRGELKVLDFGIARLLELQGSNRATTTGAAMGTPAFMPPEQASGQWNLVDARTDLWAVGATMFSLVRGRVVHHAPTVQLLLAAAMTRPAPALASAAPGVTAGGAARSSTARSRSIATSAGRTRARCSIACAPSAGARRRSRSSGRRCCRSPGRSRQDRRPAPGSPRIRTALRSRARPASRRRTRRARSPSPSHGSTSPVSAPNPNGARRWAPAPLLAAGALAVLGLALGAWLLIGRSTPTPAPTAEPTVAPAATSTATSAPKATAEVAPAPRPLRSAETASAAMPSSAPSAAPSTLPATAQPPGGLGRGAASPHTAKAKPRAAEPTSAPPRHEGSQ